MTYIQQVPVGRFPELNVFGHDYPTQDGSAIHGTLYALSNHLCLSGYLLRQACNRSPLRIIARKSMQYLQGYPRSPEKTDLLAQRLMWRIDV